MAILFNRQLFVERHKTILSDRHVSYTGDSRSVLTAREAGGRKRRHLLVIDNEVPLTALGSGYPRMRHLLSAANAAGWSVSFYPLQNAQVWWEASRAEIPWEIEILAGRGAVDLAQFWKSAGATTTAFSSAGRIIWLCCAEYCRSNLR